MKGLQRLLETLKDYAAYPCIEGDGGSHTYAQLLEEFERWQSRFDKLNVAPGTVIGLRADFSLHAIAAELALISRSAIAALIPRDRSIEHYLADAQTVAFMDLHV